MFPCGSDPDRWADPDPDDTAAKEICQQCPRRRSCASDALRMRVEGLWAGVIVPSLCPGGTQYKNRRRQYDHALEQLAHVAQVALEDSA